MANSRNPADPNKPAPYWQHAAPPVERPKTRRNADQGEQRAADRAHAAASGTSLGVPPAADLGAGYSRSDAALDPRDVD